MTVTNSGTEIELKFHQVPENDARDIFSPQFDVFSSYIWFDYDYD